MESDDRTIIRAVLGGATERFEELVVKYQPRLFAMARRYARREDEVEDIVQEIFLKSYSKLRSYREEAPFEHWIMRLATYTCYDFLRKHKRNREMTITDLSNPEMDWLDRVGGKEETHVDQSAAKMLVDRLMEGLSPDARLVITLLEIEEKSIKEISVLTGWSLPLVKVRAFRARQQMRKMLTRISPNTYL